MLVAETNGEISGFLAVHGVMVEHLYVRPDLLRRGIGSALLQRAKERLPSGFRLWVFQENVPARRFYERHGLRLVEGPMAGGTRNERRMPSTSGRPPTQRAGHKGDRTGTIEQQQRESYLAGCARIVEQARRAVGPNVAICAGLVGSGRVNIFERSGVAGGAGDVPQQRP